MRRGGASRTGGACVHRALRRPAAQPSVCRVAMTTELYFSFQSYCDSSVLNNSVFKPSAPHTHLSQHTARHAASRPYPV